MNLEGVKNTDKSVTYFWKVGGSTTVVIVVVVLAYALWNECRALAMRLWVALTGSNTRIYGRTPRGASEGKLPEHLA